MLIYDLEIIKAIPDKVGQKRLGIEYCKGWQDHANMGISCIGVYDYSIPRYRVFCEDNFEEFQKSLSEHDVLISFNGFGFDNKLLRASGFTIDDGKCFDLLKEVWVAEGLGEEFVYPSHIGYGLDEICKVNFGIEKTGHGAMAPALWQEGKCGNVIDYCLNDVFLTKRLLERVLKIGKIYSPKNGKKVIMFPEERVKRTRETFYALVKETIRKMNESAKGE